MKRKEYHILWDTLALDELDRELHYLQKRSVDAPGIIRNGILEKIKTIKTDLYICEADRFKLVNDGTYRAFIYCFSLPCFLPDTKGCHTYSSHTPHQQRSFAALNISLKYSARIKL